MAAPNEPPTNIAVEGGKRRAEVLSAEERQAIARAAAEARWEKADPLPKAILAGTLEIADREISCAVLEDGTRLLTQETFLRALGRAGKAKAGTGSERLVDGEAGLPPFLAASNLHEYISEEMKQATAPVMFRSVKGTRAYGYRADLLPKVCEVYLQAKDEGKLLRQQEKAAHAAYVLMRGLAHVGIVALVDEATGYQDQRQRDELRQILKAYISEDLLPWTERFPREFFKQIYRLNGWEFNPATTKRTPLVGKMINRYIYDQLPQGVLAELCEKNPVVPEKSYRRYKHHQFLTPDTGHVHLDRQITKVITLMQLSDNKSQFDLMFDKLYNAEAMVQPILTLEVPKDDGPVRKVLKPNRDLEKERRKQSQPSLFEFGEDSTTE